MSWVGNQEETFYYHEKLSFYGETRLPNKSRKSRKVRNKCKTSPDKCGKRADKVWDKIGKVRNSLESVRTKLVLSEEKLGKGDNKSGKRLEQVQNKSRTFSGLSLGWVQTFLVFVLTFPGLSRFRSILFQDLSRFHLCLF